MLLRCKSISGKGARKQTQKRLTGEGDGGNGGDRGDGGDGDDDAKELKRRKVRATLILDAAALQEH